MKGTANVELVELINTLKELELLKETIKTYEDKSKKEIEEIKTKSNRTLKAVISALIEISKHPYIDNKNHTSNFFIEICNTAFTKQDISIWYKAPHSNEIIIGKGGMIIELQEIF